MKFAVLALLIATFLFGTALIFAGDIKVIANSSVQTDSISADDLRAVFLLERRTLRDGSTVIPVLEKDGATHQAFLKLYLNCQNEELHTYYQGLVFTGKSSMPKEFRTDEEVVRYVAATNGVIAYVSSEARVDGTKVLAVLPEKSKGGRKLLTRVSPDYPLELRQRGIEGTVRLELTVSPKGAVESVRVIGGNPILADAALRAARKWIYSPSATGTTIQVSIPFEVRP